MSLNKNNFLKFFMFFSATTIVAQNSAQDSLTVEDLSEVIVTATRTERQLSSLPLPAQLISRNEINRVNSIRLSDILNEQTGLTTVPDFGGGEGIQLQGLDSQYTLILIDGVPLIGRSAGTLDINRITVGNIKQIEVVKGASSSLYGSEALGGVVNIITENPKEGLSTIVNYRVASFNNDANINIGYRKNKSALTAYVNRYSSGGYDLDKSDELKTVDPFVNYTVSSKIMYEFTESTNLFFSGRYYYQDQDYNPSSDLAGKSELNEWNTHLKLDHKFNDKWNSFIEFYATNYKATEYLNTIDDNSRFSESSFDQYLIRPEFRTSYTLNKSHSFIGGVGWNHETLKRDDFLKNPEFDSQYIYLQYDGKLNNKLNLIAGARFDNHSEYKSQFSPKMALRYDLSDKIALKGSIGYGFKAPDFRQLYFDFTNSSVGYTVLGYNAVSTRIPQLDDEGVISNIVVPVSEFENELKPESSIAYNIGFQYKPNTSISFDLNLFRNDISNLIDTRVIANRTNGQNVFSYYNVNKVYTQGFEFNAVWRLLKTLKITSGYQLLFAKDKTAEDSFEKGEVFARDPNTLQTFRLDKSNYFGLYNRSRHMINLKVFYDIPKWDFNTNIRATYRSKYGILDSNTNGYLDTYDNFVEAYTILDWALNKTFFEDYSLGMGIDNLLDFTDSQNISNIPGRIIYGKLNIQF